MKRKLACIFAAMMLTASVPAYAEDNVSFIENDETGSVKTETDETSGGSSNSGSSNSGSSSSGSSSSSSSSSSYSSGKSSVKKETKTEEEVEEIINPFKDVSEAAWYYDCILDVNKKGLMSGMGDNMFQPDSTLTRGMVASIVYRMAGSPYVEYKPLFTDVPNGEWYTSGVIWAYENGVIAGYGNGLYGTYDPITVEQMAAILYRYSGSPAVTGDITTLATYSDREDITEYAKSAIVWAIQNDMHHGSTVHAKANATRAEAAKMFSAL